MRRAAKRDDNERAIISTWEAMGAYVESVSGPGLADTLVHYKGQIYRAEVKGAKRGLTEKQVECFTKAYDAEVFTFIVRSVEDARAVLSSACRAWTPSDGALAGAARRERAFRPGTDRARTLAESCKVDCCITSAVPGSSPPRCAAHAAEETFAPDMTREEVTIRTRLGTPVRKAFPMGCPACRIDPQTPCKHDGEEKGVTSGTQPPRRRNQRAVDRLVTVAEHLPRSGP